MTCGRLLVFSGYPGFLTNKTYLHDISEILLKVKHHKTKPIITDIIFQTLLNQRTLNRPDPMYLASILPAYFVMLTMGVIAFFTAGGSAQNLKAAIACKGSAKYVIE